MSCEHGGHHGGHRRGHHGCGCGCGHHHGDSCGCGQHNHFQRRFWTKEEQIAQLELYLENLQEEAKAVQERIAAMKGE
jgi:hypothetical protein